MKEETAVCRSTVLVTGGENRAALAVTRSLGRYGCRVIVVGSREKNLSSSSKYCGGAYAVSHNKGAEQYVKELRRIIALEHVDFVYPITEPECLSLATFRNQLPHNVKVAVPALEKLKKIYDKFFLFKRAIALNVPIPQTIFVKGEEDYRDKIEQVQCYPVVVKPGMSNIPMKGRYLKTGVQYAASFKELKYLYETSKALRYPSLIQEKIEGPGTGFFTLFSKGRHLATFSHERLREKPPSGGVSVLSKSVAVVPEMAEAASKLLADVGWEGVAMVEFKKDNRDGQAKLMEINGRFWGTLQLAISAGVNFPVLLHEYMAGMAPARPEKYQIGLRMKWLLGTLDHLIIRLRTSESELNLSPGASGKFKAFLEFCQIYEKNMVFDVFSLEDPKPFCHELGDYVKKNFLRITDGK